LNYGTHTKPVFYIQKKIIRIMAGTKRRVSCMELFKKFNILPLTSEVLLSLSSFVVDNRNISNKLRYPHISTRYRYNIHVPNTNLSKYRKEFTILELSYSIIFLPLSKV
jgi:hypothetical protein